MQRILCWIVLGVLLASPGAVTAWVTDKSVALDEVGIRAKADYVPGRVIIKFKEGFREAAVATLAGDASMALGGVRMAHVKPIKGVKADLYSIPEDTDMEAMILKIRSDPRVAYVEPDYYLWPTATPNDPFFPLQWGLHNTGQEVLGQRGTAGADINAVAAWDITQGGRDVIVAVIDSGLNLSHPDIAPNLWYNIQELQGAGNYANWRPDGIDDDGNGYVDDVVGWDFVNDTHAVVDNDGHGTHVAGIAAAAGNNNIGVAGVSWRSRIMPLAVRDPATGGYPISAIAEALVYAQRMGAHVVNLSFDTYSASQTLQDAVNQATSPVLCAAAGNRGIDNDIIPHYPSNYPNANLIAVAATDPDDALASFSNFGENNVDVAAPGVNILSTYYINSIGSAYTYASGTSMAAPMVAGVAALIRSQRPGLSAAQVVSIIKDSVDLLDDLADRVSTGGRVNAAQALQTDTDGDGVADIDDLDDDNDGITDCVENGLAESCTLPAVLADTDGDGVPNHLDLDSDNDGVSDLVESDIIVNGLPQVNGGNGVIDEAHFSDSDNDGLADIIETTYGQNTGTPPSVGYLNLDQDGDGCPDAIEGLRIPTYTFADLVSGGRLDLARHPVDSKGVPGGTFQNLDRSLDNEIVPCNDYGDAPDSYGTTEAMNGAVNTVATDPTTLLPALYLGQTDPTDPTSLRVDIEADGQPDASAALDSHEEGVVFSYNSGVVTATVDVTNNHDQLAYLCCWLDGGVASATDTPTVNGTFEDTTTEERCLEDPIPANTPSDTYEFSWHFPITVTTTTYARCRVSTASAPGPTGGLAGDPSTRGEVEDYKVTVNPTSATVGAFTVGMDSVEEFLAQLSARGDLPALLERYDPALSETLSGADISAVQKALKAILDADGDGLLAVARWETLEERGTAGFYVERRDPGEKGFTRVNPTLLSGLIHAPRGGQYWLADPGVSAPGTYRYRLVEQEAWGTQKTYGPWDVRVGRGGRVQPAGRLIRESGEADGFSAWKVLGQGYGARMREAKAPQFEKVAAQLAARLQARSEGLASAKSAAVSRKKKKKNRKNWLYTDQPGLYGLTVNELSGLTGKKARKIRRQLSKGRYRLTNKDRLTPYHFDPVRDTLYFVGEAHRTLYTDENAYRLVSSGRGSRMAVVTGVGPGAGGVVGEFTETLTLETDDLAVPWVVSDGADADYWFDRYIVKGREGHDPLQAALILPDAAPTGRMTLRLHIQGGTNIVPGPDHRVRVWLNDTELGLLEWDGHAEAVLEAEADQSLLKPADNVLKLASEVSGTFQYFNRVVVSYQRLMRAHEGRLWMDDLPAGIHTVDGFGSAEIVVMEGPGTPDARRRKDITVSPSAGGGYEVSFSAADRTADYLVAEASSALTPRVSADRPSRLGKRDKADYLIIAPRELSKTASALASYRGERFSVKIAWLDDIYDEFAYGRVDPDALERFLSRVHRRWRRAPEYVVLLGRGTLDHRDRKGRSDSLIPVRMTLTPWGLYASDNRYADIDKDGVAEFALGRIPVSHDSAGLAYVKKLKAYEASPSGEWTGRAVVVADKPDAAAGDFHADSDVIAADLSAEGYTARRAYHPDDAPNDNTLRGILTDSGTWKSAYVNYVGHGSRRQLGGGSQGFMKSADVSSLSNDVLPLFAAFTCSVGNDTYPGDDSVTGELVRHGKGGAVAALAPTGLSLDSDAHVLNREFVRGLTSDGRSLGEAWRESQARALGSVSPFMLEIYQVTGDPAVHLP